MQPTQRLRSLLHNTFTQTASHGVTLVAACSLLILFTPHLQCAAGEKSDTQPLFSEAAIVVGAVDDPVLLTDSLLSLPWQTIAEEIPATAAFFTSPQYIAGQAGLFYVQQQLNADYREIMRVAAGKGIRFAIADKQAFIVVARSPEPNRLPALVRAVTQLAAGMPVGKNLDAPEPTGTYRGIEAYELNNVGVAVVGEHLLLSNNKELAKSTIDRLLDAKRQTDLSSTNQIEQHIPTGMPSSLRIAVAHDRLPNSQTALQEAQGLAKDFGAELLAGGFLSALDPNGFSQWILTTEEMGLRLDMSLLLSADATEQPRRELRREIVGGTVESDSLEITHGGFWTVDDLMDSVDKQTLVTFHFDRDLALLWAEKDQLLQPPAAAQLDVADSQLSTAFGGFDFGEEVLGALAPTMQIVVLPAVDSSAAPPVLPQAAIVAKLRDDQATNVSRRFRIAWQTVIGLINVERGGQGQPQLELITDREEELQTVTGSYNREDAAQLNATSADFYSTLAPTMATTNRHIVLATTDELAKTVVRTAAKSNDTQGYVATIVAQGTPIAASLQQNRPLLIGQNMMDQGHSRSQAETEIDSLIAGVRAVDKIAARVATTPTGLRATARLILRQPKQ